LAGAAGSPFPAHRHELEARPWLAPRARLLPLTAMNWLLDNINVVYILLGIAALGLAVAGWVTRRVKFFALAGIPIVLIALVWLLTQFVVSDRQQIERNVQAIAQAAVAKDGHAIVKHLSHDFSYNGLKRDQIAELVNRTIDQWQISAIKVWEFDVVQLSRDEKSAKVNFKMTVSAAAVDRPTVVLCVTEWVLENDQWKMRSFDPRNPMQPDQKMPGAP